MSARRTEMSDKKVILVTGAAGRTARACRKKGGQCVADSEVTRRDDNSLIIIITSLIRVANSNLRNSYIHNSSKVKRL